MAFKKGGCLWLDPVLCILLFFLCWDCLYISQIVSWYTSQLWYRCRGGMFRWQIFSQIDPVHNLHHNMCEGSCIITYFCGFLHRLFWRNIDVVFHFFEIFFIGYIIGLWGGAWDILCHLWYQWKRVLLGHSCIHWYAW